MASPSGFSWVVMRKVLPAAMAATISDIITLFRLGELLQYSFDTAAALYRRIILEHDVGGISHPEVLPHLFPDEPAGAVEPLLGCLLFLVGPDHGKIDGGKVEVVRDLDTGYGDEADAGIFQPL